MQNIINNFNNNNFKVDAKDDIEFLDARDHVVIKLAKST